MPRPRDYAFLSRTESLTSFRELKPPELCVDFIHLLPRKRTFDLKISGVQTKTIALMAVGVMDGILCGENSLSVISGRLIALVSHLYPRGFLPSFWQCSCPPRGVSRPVFPFPSSVSFGKIRRSSFSSPHFSLSLLLTSHR